MPASRLRPVPFQRSEFLSRMERARRHMERERLDALLVTSEFNFNYLTGLVTQFWQSLTRPWFFVLPREGEPVAVVSEHGAVVMRATAAVDRIETWPSPQPWDEGISTVSAVIKGIKREFGRIGVEMGPESRLGFPAADFLKLRDGIAPFEFADGAAMINKMRGVKSQGEVDRIKLAGDIVCDAFRDIAEISRPGITERELNHRFHTHLLSLGADAVPYLIVTSGAGGYTSTILPSTERALGAGDVLLMHVCAQIEGYFTDVPRIFAIGEPSKETERAYDFVWRSTQAGLDAMRPGVLTRDVWQAEFDVLRGAGPAARGERMGHGVGFQITESPSVTRQDETVLEPGLVVSVEPNLTYGNGFDITHEEILVMTETDKIQLTERTPRHIPVLPA